MRALALIAFLIAQATAMCAETIEFRNGRWFDGSHFHRGTMYSIEGVLCLAKPARVDRVIALDGKYVIPPLAEGHNHWLEPEKVDEYNARYLAGGVFYVMDQGTVPPVVRIVREKTNRHDTVDYIAAVLGFTGPGGHPIEIVRQFVKMNIFPAEWERGFDRNAVLVVENEHDIAERWPLLHASKTDFVKLFLLYSEEYEERKNDDAHGYDRGLDPKLVGPIVKRAHADGWRVSAHIYSAADFRNAVAGGVDIIAHMPGTGAGEHPNEIDRYRLTDADAAGAKRAGVVVISTLSWNEDLRSTKPELADRLLRDVIRPNVRTLRRHRVPIVVGSDQFREIPRGELRVLARLGLFSNAEIVRMATTDTSRFIFPNRKIGRLAEGFEANFLVLDGDPAAHLENLATILLRVKSGRILP